MKGLGCISVDLDSLPHYCRIHGLSEELLDPRARDLVYQVAVPRFLELFSEAGLTGTFFAIGEDLETDAAREALRTAHRVGIEVASHSLTHDYALTRRSPETITRELKGAERAIAAITGDRPVGFRAPGYTLSAPLVQALCARGYRYDASAFPAAPYYLAKATVMGVMKLLGRSSRAILDTPRALAAPRLPYHPAPDDPYRRGDAPLVELPITVSALLRLPFIGTLAVSAPERLTRGIYRGLRTRPFFNFELHAVDLLDETDGIPAALVRSQRDLAIGSAHKRSRLKAVFEWLKADYEVVTLAEAATRLG